MTPFVLVTILLILPLIESAKSHQYFGGTPEMAKCVKTARGKPDFNNQMLSDCVGFSTEDRVCLGRIPTQTNSMNTLLRALDCFSGVPKAVVQCSKPYYEWEAKRDEIIRNIRTTFSEVSIADLNQIIDSIYINSTSTNAELAEEYHVPLELFDHLIGSNEITTQIRAAGKLCGDVLLSLDWPVRKRVETLIWLKWQVDEATNSKLFSGDYQVYSNGPNALQISYYWILYVLTFNVILGICI